jgi:hypothetical protein
LTGIDHGASASVQHPEGDDMGGFHQGRAVLGGCLAAGILLAVSVGVGGCGGDDGGGGGGTDPLPCAITNVNTGALTSWLVGLDEQISVRWDHQGSATAVRIDLLKAGVPVFVVSASTPNTGFYPWVVPTTDGEADGTDFGLRVTALGETGCAGEKTGLTLINVSDCALTWAMAPLNTINAGAVLSLEWDGVATGGLVDIELWQDAVEAQLVGVVARETPDDGQFTWDPVDSFNFGTSDSFYLRLSASLVPGCEVRTGRFSMVDDVVCACRVTGFSAGTAFTVGQSLNLTLQQDFGSGRVNLRLLAGAELVPGGIIAAEVPVGQVCNWIVNDFGYTGADRTRFHIRATDADDGYCVGQSDAFTIQ